MSFVKVTKTLCSWSCAVLALGGLAMGVARPGNAFEIDEAVTIAVESASAKVGEKTSIVARITPKPGFLITDTYRNRVSQLSALDEKSVDFANKVVRGAMQNGSLVFKVDVTPKTSGSHPINGVLRFSFVKRTEDVKELDIKWAPLIATVTGTE